MRFVHEDVNWLTKIVVFTWPYFLGSFARVLRSRSWLSLDMSQQENSAYLSENTWEISSTRAVSYHGKVSSSTPWVALLKVQHLSHRSYFLTGKIFSNRYQWDEGRTFCLQTIKLQHSTKTYHRLLAPCIVLFPFIGMLHQLQMGVIDFLLDLGEVLPRCFQGLVGSVALGELLTKFLHQLQPFLTNRLGAPLLEKSL